MFVTRHTAEVDETYFQHMKFVMGLATYTWVASFFFMVHALLPFIEVPREYDLAQLQYWVGRWRNNRKSRRLRAKRRPQVACSSFAKVKYRYASSSGTPRCSIPREL